MTGLLIGLLLLLGNAYFVGAEFALLAARRTRLDQMAAAGSERARTAADAAGRLSLMLAGAQLGITVCSLGLGAVAEPALAHILEPLLGTAGLPEELAHPVAFAVALTVVVALHMVLGEMVPKNLALAAPERFAVMLGPSMVGFSRVVHPLLRLLNAFANVLLRLGKVEPQDEINAAYTGRQLLGVLAESREAGLLDADEHGLASGALVLGDSTARDAMVPITGAVTVPENATAGQIEGQVAATGLSRFPVARADGTVEEYVHVHDLVATAGNAHDRPLAPDALRPLVTVPESMPLARVLIELRNTRRHLARVVDQDGTVVGILSFDDVVRPLLSRGAVDGTRGA